MIIHYHSLPDKADILPHLWQRMITDHPPPWIWGNAGPLTLTEFICYFSDPLRQLFLVLTPDGQDFVGIAWLDELIVGQRARGHFYFFSKYRGKPSARIKQTCQTLKQIIAAPPFSLKLLLLFTDTRATDALRVAQRHLGATYFTDPIPGYYPGESCVYMGYLPLKGSDHGQCTGTVSDGEHGNHGNGDARDWGHADAPPQRTA